MCSPDEGPKRTETSHLLIKSLELRCHAHIFSLFVLLYSNTRDVYLFVAMHFIFIYICIHIMFHLLIKKYNFLRLIEQTDYNVMINVTA